MQKLLEQYGPDEVEVERYAAFLESGPWAVSREASLRDAKEFTVPAILDRDIDVYRQLCRQKEPTAGLIVPAPRYLVRWNRRLGRFPALAPSSHYSERYGLFNDPVEDHS